MKRRRRKDPRQTTFAFRPTGRGGARPGAGRPRVRRSRVPHRARFVRAFRETLRRGAERTGFRVVHYSVQDNHAHFLVEADDKEKLANGMKSLAVCRPRGGLPSRDRRSSRAAWAGARGDAGRHRLLWRSGRGSRGA